MKRLTILFCLAPTFYIDANCVKSSSQLALGNSTGTVMLFRVFY
jgi:hypothetical protein